VWFVPSSAGWFDCEVQVRAHGAAVPARARATDGGAGLEVAVEGALRSVAAGQSVVLYDGTRVLAQATVAAARR